jgi:class 3 adenylate cyclase
MALGDDLRSEVASIFHSDWKERTSPRVPSPEQVALGNDAVSIDSAVLYADLADSTKLVDTHKGWFAAEVYKAYLRCATKVIVVNGGEITAFDGDRVMGVFVGPTRCSDAVRTGLQINYVVSQIINPQIAERYKDTQYRIRQVVGIDASKLFVAKTGIRGSNDLVWVGRAANYAAKLSSVNEAPFSSLITDTVFLGLPDDYKWGGTPKQAMWEPRPPSNMGGVATYRSRWYWAV